MSTETYPTINLRFCRKGNPGHVRYILQQEWCTATSDAWGNVDEPPHREWRDVPTVEEGT
jgi:hypothetical protein